jgi:hypothetical protein
VFQARLTNDVYHYTGVDTAIYGILDRGAIRLGPYESTNDPQESRPKFPPLSSHHDHEPADNEVHQIWTHADWWLRRYVKVACFTQDFELPENALDENALRGWAHASEWAHYGADHGGACLRFDRTKLVEQFHAQMGSRGQCFDGAVAYPVQRFSGLPVDLLDLGQVREFGIDAVVSRYIEKHYEDLFFTKHHDWANECEYRLILNDQSLLPAYLDISDCLTGVFLGDAFPAERGEVIRHLMDRFPQIELVQLRYHNGRLLRTPTNCASDQLGLTPRRAGTMSERLEALRTIELQREQAKIEGATQMEAVLEGLRAVVSSAEASCQSWQCVAADVYPQATAIPPEQRSRKPGVLGEVVILESGSMCVVENLPKQSLTLTIALAAQLLEEGTVRLHGAIQLETWSATGNETSELWRETQEVPLVEAVAMIATLQLHVDAELPLAKESFDSQRPQILDSAPTAADGEPGEPRQGS